MNKKMTKENKTRVRYVRFPQDLDDNLVAHSIKTYDTISHIIRQAVQDWLKKQSPQTKGF